MDNNLYYLEAIHNFVEVLNEYFHNVCELDLVFNFYKVEFSFSLTFSREILLIYQHWNKSLNGDVFTTFSKLPI